MESRKKQRRDREAKRVKPRAKPVRKVATTRSAKPPESTPKVPRWKAPLGIPVNFSKVAPDNSYDAPDYI